MHSRFLLKIYAGISQGADRCRVTTADTPRCRDFSSISWSCLPAPFGFQVDHILAEGDVVVVLCTDSARRGDRSWSSPQVHVWTVRDGYAVTFRQYQGDQQTEDEFWSEPV